MAEPGPESGEVPIHEERTLAAAAFAAAATPTYPLFGDYRVLRKLGEGGMGVVYEAMQQHPRRAVALKVLRACSDDDERVRNMFHREIRALARLKHPGIATIYDSGLSQSGDYFYAMELVKGRTWQSVLAHADLKKEREKLLQVFLQVCDAVHYAHQRGVIHRDLKPSNVLVEAAENGERTAKVLDFGLARITDSDGVSAVTQPGLVQGSMPYMSPEQILAAPEQIDIRTDVYSLGVMLYETVAGQPPYDLREASFARAAYLICNQAPAALGETRCGAGINLDLDLIIAKVLDKDPAGRYQSVSALADDLRRHLSGQPILARPPSAAYQVKKLVSRHKVIASVAAAFLLSLMVFAVSLSIQTHRLSQALERANRESETSRRVVQFMAEMFRAADPNQSRGRTVTARDIVDAGAQRIDTELKGQPLVQATMKEAIGNVYQQLSLYDQAKPLLEDSLRLRRQGLGEQSPETARSLYSLAVLARMRGDVATDEKLARQSLELRTKLLGEVHPETVASMNELAESLRIGRNFAAAGPLYRRALQIRQQMYGESDGDVAQSLNNLALLLYERYVQEGGDLENCEELYRKAVEIRRKVDGPDHPLVAIPLSNLVLLKTRQGKFDEAESILQEMLALRKKVFGELHPQYLRGLRRLGNLLEDKGDRQGAEAVYRDVIPRFEATADRDWLDDTRQDLASLLQNKSEFEEAGSFYRKALQSEEQGLGRRSLKVAATLNNLGTLYQSEGDLAAATRAFEEALAIRRELLGPDHLLVARSLAALGQMETVERDFPKAEGHLREALAIRTRKLGAKHTDTARVTAQIAETYIGRNSLDQAESLARDAIGVFREASASMPPDAASVISVWARVLEAKKNYEEAAGMFRQALELSIRRVPTDSLQIAIAQRDLAHCLLLEGRLAEAGPLLVASLPTLERTKSPFSLDARRDLDEVRRARGK